MKFLKTTIIGGLFFLIPVVVVLMVVGKALDVMTAVAEPAAELLPIDSLGGVEKAVLQKIPGYTLFKGITDKLTSPDTDSVHAVLVSFGHTSRVSIEIERISQNRVVVYVPSSPSPWTGEVHVVNSDQVERLDYPITTVIEHVEQLGGGSSRYLGNA